jgi:hypothetical protein
MRQEVVHKDVVHVLEVAAGQGIAGHAVKATLTQPYLSKDAGEGRFHSRGALLYINRNSENKLT